MVSGFVVDASVAVKWVVTERYSEEAAGLLESGAVLLAPELIYAEAASAIWALARRGDFLSTEARDALAVIIDAPLALPLSMRKLAPLAASLASDIDHPVFDCFYLALAVNEQFPVITADRRFCDKVHAHSRFGELILHIADLSKRLPD